MSIFPPIVLVLQATTLLFWFILIALVSVFPDSADVFVFFFQKKINWLVLPHIKQQTDIVEAVKAADISQTIHLVYTNMTPNEW